VAPHSADLTFYLKLFLGEEGWGLFLHDNPPPAVRAQADTELNQRLSMNTSSPSPGPHSLIGHQDLFMQLVKNRSSGNRLPGFEVISAT
jgi:hypothetical protein